MLTKIVRLTIFLLFIPLVSVAQDLSHKTGEYKFIENGGKYEFNDLETALKDLLLD